MPRTPQTHTARTFDAAATLDSIKRMAFEAGVPPTEFIKSLQANLQRTADPLRALNNVQRFLSAGFSETTLRDFHRHPVLQHVALEIFSQSQYLADILIRNPELFNWITSTSALGRVSAKSTYLDEARRSIEPFERFDKKINALKRFHRRELLRIGAREILKEVVVSTTADELSRLADAVVQVVLELVTQQVLGNNAQTVRSMLAVIGLGKLGGGELNFSSDIDLQFVYDADGDFEAPELRVKTLHELYSRIAETTVRKLTELTDEGRFYRVDLRLRPEGTIGPIALSRAAAMNYYETRGEQWERQMLIKARVIAGDIETGERFLNEIKPFIFPRTQLSSPLEEIAAIKRKIEANTDAETNIKLGSGGIRDIEFIIQALQMLNAGKNEILRDRNTLTALEHLSVAKLLSAREANTLRSAYTFHRTLEHRLQLLFGKQTHSLPESPAEVEFLAKRLGFRNTAAFRRTLERHRATVRKIFASVFVLKSTPAAAASGLSLQAFRKFVFLDGRKASERINKVFESLPEWRESKLQTKLLAALAQYKAPDLALQNLALLAGNKHLRRSLLQALSSDGARDLVMLVCSRSPYLAHLLAASPLLFETLLSNPAEVLDEGLGWDLMKSDLANYRSFNEFKISLRWLKGSIDIAKAANDYSNLADNLVMQRLHSLSADAAVPFAVFAVGKYGGKEITVGSDLDLLFIYRKADESSALKAESVARDFANAFLENGKTVYDIDMRLRPEGKNAPLAVEIEYYRDYLHSRASLWERQSLVKFRPIGGDEALQGAVMLLVQEYAYSAPLPRRWVDDVASMRTTIERERTKGMQSSNDLKVGRGGLVDIEFLLQMLQLKYGAERQELRTTSSFELLDTLRSSKILKRHEVDRLSDNLKFLRSLETLVRLNATQSGFILPNQNDQRVALAAGMGQKSVRSLLARIKKIQQANRALLQQVYKICKQ
ncbi:MAG: hypothetical protein L0Y80_03520 [Ignavibacteriae bacterium]|nr:hypothetical protein [Ignavibacteriota bacterium]